MIATFMIALLTVQTPQAEQPGPRHWTEGQIRWRQMPIPAVPSGETGTVQAQLTCTVGGRGRVRDCRIDRAAPQGTRFGQAVLRNMSRATLREDGKQAGDTLTFQLRACSDILDPCEPIAWPEG
jgi:hypothetical protein